MLHIVVVSRKKLLLNLLASKKECRKNLAAFNNFQQLTPTLREYKNCKKFIKVVSILILCCIYVKLRQYVVKGIVNLAKGNLFLFADLHLKKYWMRYTQIKLMIQIPPSLLNYKIFII